MPDFIAAFEEFQTGSGKINEWTIEDEYMQASYSDGLWVRWYYNNDILFIE